MARPTSIDVQAFRSEINRMLDLFEKKGVSSVRLNDDFYWAVNWGDDLLREPPELAVGSLVDDLDFLHLDAPQEPPVAIMLSHAAPLLHYLGQKASGYGVF